jgi:hypothetical protein
VTLLDWTGLKRLAAGVVVTLFVWASPGVTRAADEPAAAPAPEEAAAETPSEKPPEEKQEAPRLQLQDEGPAASSERGRQPRLQLTQTDDAVERPYWKNWVFWAVAAGVVIGAAVTMVYMNSGDTGVAPCPVDIVGELGCYGVVR